MPIHVVQSLDASAASATPAIRMNQYQVPFNVGFGIYTTGGGDSTLSVQHCFDTEVTANTQWYDHTDVSATTTVSASSRIDGNYAYPVAHVRMNLTAVSGTPTTRWIVLQTGE
jgi:hypothetical protein